MECWQRPPAADAASCGRCAGSHPLRRSESDWRNCALCGRRSPSALLEVERQGQRSTPVRLSVGGASPALFTANQSGTGQVSAVNQDGTPNSASNPAAVGSVVSLYATGEGAVTARWRRGARCHHGTTVTARERTSRRSGRNYPEFAGGSPGSIVGLLQVNIRIPAGVSGPNVPVVLQVAVLPARKASRLQFASSARGRVHFMAAEEDSFDV